MTTFVHSMKAFEAKNGQETTVCDVYVDDDNQHIEVEVCTRAAASKASRQTSDFGNPYPYYTGGYDVISAKAIELAQRSVAWYERERANSNK